MPNIEFGEWVHVKDMKLMFAAIGIEFEVRVWK
jgi:hypothetical protein